MNPSGIGVAAMVLGVFIALAGFLMGGNIIIVGIGFLFLILGGVSKNKAAIQVCPHCRSEIDAKASVCSKCTREIKK